MLKRKLHSDAELFTKQLDKLLEFAESEKMIPSNKRKSMLL
jgi:hypothetical protein